MSSIPDELFHDILSRLPAKSLLVCKCVCKNWFELISNPSFVHAHANLITQRNNFSLTKCYAETGNEYIVCSIGYDSLGGSEQDEHADDMLFKGGLIYSGRTFTDLLCSCNGLVCLYFRNKRKICLWNPATKEYKKLHKAPTSLGSVDFYDCALGYDYKINDYKFVTLVQLDNNNFEILVYTLGSNSWKKIQNISCVFTMGQSGVPVDGAFHWLGGQTHGCHSIFIISFDISSERSSDIQLPKEAAPDEGWCSSVRVLEGRLCFVHVVRYCDYIRAGEFQVILWVMQEYGVEESWSKRYVINHERIQEHYYELSLMWCFKNGEILFAGDRSKLFIYDPKYGSVRLANVNGLSITNGESYFETLVSLKSGMYIGGNGQGKLSIEDEGEEEESIQFSYD